MIPPWEHLDVVNQLFIMYGDKRGSGRLCMIIMCQLGQVCCQSNILEKWADEQLPIAKKCLLDIHFNC